MKRRLATIIILMTVGATAAYADSFTLDFNYSGYNLTYYLAGQRSSVYLGSVTITVPHPTPSPDGLAILGSPFEAYCVDLLHYSHNGDGVLADLSDWSIDIYPKNDSNAGHYAAFLLDAYAAGAATNIKKAALQVAIWEVLFENGIGFNLADGNFQTSSLNSSVLSQANTYLSGIPANVSNYEAWWIQTSHQGFNDQDFGAPRAMHAPEPGSLILLGTGLLAIAGYGIRRKK
jgi:hypothetical protein